MARRTNDVYPTPPALARLGWQIAQRYVASRTTLRVCEPGCGDAQPFLRAALGDPRVVVWDGCDVRAVAPGDPRFRVAQRDWTEGGDFGEDVWDVIVTNPPFSVAEAFARRALGRLAPGGVAVLLVRLSFLATAARRAFWADFPPAELAVIRPRPSFTGDGASDTSEYAFCAWVPDGAQPPIVTWRDWERPAAVRTRVRRAKRPADDLLP
jgi:hypothetical protein